jgi:hypothetical protein
MIASWKEFFTAVDQMREAQKLYFLSKSHTALFAAKKREAVVDECIEQKRAEWARQEQPNLI